MKRKATLLWTACVAMALVSPPAVQTASAQTASGQAAVSGQSSAAPSDWYDPGDWSSGNNSGAVDAYGNSAPFYGGASVTNDEQAYKKHYGSNGDYYTDTNTKQQYGRDGSSYYDNYYTNDWFSDGSRFDSWYDNSF